MKFQEIQDEELLQVKSGAGLSKLFCKRPDNKYVQHHKPDILSQLFISGRIAGKPPWVIHSEWEGLDLDHSHCLDEQIFAPVRILGSHCYLWMLKKLYRKLHIHSFIIILSCTFLKDSTSEWLRVWTVEPDYLVQVQVDH